MAKRRGRAGAREGFTLIELLVVVLIIGILAAIAIPQYFKVVEKARFSEQQTSVSDAAGAEERAYARIGSYQTDWSSLDVQFIAPNNNSPWSGGTGRSKYYTYVLSSSNGNVWTLVSTRQTDTYSGQPPGRYGTYSITYTCGAGNPCSPTSSGNNTELFN